MNFPGLFSSRLSKTNKLLIFFLFVAFVIIALLSSYAYSFGFLFPPEFDRVVVNIPKGSTAYTIAELLAEHHVIRSPESFLMYVKLFGNDKAFRPGVFVFSGIYSVSDVIRDLQRPAATRQITLLEGWTVRKMGEYFEEEGIFAADDFVNAAEKYEGQLFPNTYEIYLDTTPGEVVALLHQEFEKQIQQYDKAITESKRLREDIIIMASMLEKEANNDEERRIIAGILWKRLDNDVPLQVDATVTYVTGKNSYSLTIDDLAIDSPYNTYKYTGLPLGPIANPSRSAIEAALFPQESPYWYYLHDRKGAPHYAATFEKHKENKFKYLR